MSDHIQTKNTNGETIEEQANPLETLVMWRSVENELPEEHEDVLVYYYGNKDSKHFPELQFIKQTSFYNERFECDEEVTHWTKLPEPPLAT